MADASQPLKYAPVVLGIDGGASKTACAAVDKVTGEALVLKYVGPSNWCGTCRRYMQMFSTLPWRMHHRT